MSIKHKIDLLPVVRVEMRWFKSVDSGSPELQYRYEFLDPLNGKKTLWTEWETVPFVLEGVDS